jgi:UDP-N-acetylmuramoyl-L-alanyl-D-glutamate--2,6-diaminopimelate ligase
MHIDLVTCYSSLATGMSALYLSVFEQPASRMISEGSVLTDQGAMLHEPAKGRRFGNLDKMKLGQILEGLLHFELRGDPALEIKGLAYDSRQVKPGDLFVAIRGHRSDGHRFVDKAVEKGAVALALETLTGREGKVATVLVPDSRKALSKLALAFYANPFKPITLIGITGTSGKTTTTYLLESIVNAAGGKPGVLGTVNYRYAGKTVPAPVTTPESLDLIRLSREMVDHGVTHIVMEVSSHALDQGRTQDCPFQVAVFTNLSRDHLDYHNTMDEYFAAKSRLFRGLLADASGRMPAAVINLDDPRGKELVGITQTKVLTYGLGKGCQVGAGNIQRDGKGLRFRLRTPAGEAAVRSSLIGDFNVYNILAAAGAGLALDLPLEAVVQGIEELKSIPGRLERVENRRGLTLVVDYSHKPDALLKAMTSLKPYVEGRLITVFGCGGDRDRGKRYDMGRLAGEHSDVAFITSDNPRSEDPLSIVKEIEKGMLDSGLKKGGGNSHPGKGYYIEVDRRRAIQKAVAMAEEGDVVLIAGKGHEDYQIIGSERRPFSDQEEAAKAASEGV